MKKYKHYITMAVFPALWLVTAQNATAVELEFDFNNSDRLEAGAMIEDYDPGLQCTKTMTWARVDTSLDSLPIWIKSDKSQWAIQLSGGRLILMPPKDDPTLFCGTQSVKVETKILLESFSSENSVIVGRWHTGDIRSQSWMIGVEDGELVAKFRTENEDEVILLGPILKEGVWHDIALDIAKDKEGVLKGALLVDGKAVAQQASNGQMLNHAIDVDLPNRAEPLTTELIIGSARNQELFFRGSIEFMKLTIE